MNSTKLSQPACTLSDMVAGYNAFQNLILAESLRLLSTYASGPAVELGEWMSGVSPVPEDETDEFLGEVRARHSIAITYKLRDVLQGIERNFSHKGTLSRQESRGVIRGRLDAPRYIAMRSRSVSLPRRYPIVSTEQSPETPENVLVGRTLRALVQELAWSPFPANSAEHQKARTEYGWFHTRLRRYPWDSIRRLETVERLWRETDLRIRRRQTGNEREYQMFLDWLAEWLMDPKLLGHAERVEGIIDGLLAFPASEMFWDKVFEIWCLQEVGNSLKRLGLQIIEGPRPLYARGSGPIWRFNEARQDVGVWFQRQWPLSPARWSYVGGGFLVGIPDIIIESHGRPLLLVDAKNRVVSTRTRPEETYKMLGYAENFRPESDSPFWGLLLFPGESNSSVELVGPKGGRLRVVTVDLIGDRGAAAASIDRSLKQWLALRPTGQGEEVERHNLNVAEP